VYLDGKGAQRFQITMVHVDGRNCSYQLRLLDREELYKDGEKFPQGKLRHASYGPKNPRYEGKGKPH
jgi:hypothetical protein